MYVLITLHLAPSRHPFDSTVSPVTRMRIHSSQFQRRRGWLPQLQRPALSTVSRLLPWARFGPRSRDSSFLRSARLSASLFTTTNYADFSPTLMREISPGKVHVLSTRAVKLYLMRLSVTVGFRVP